MSSSSSSVGCLLPAENLRCIPLNLIQMHALTIPPVIELVFCVFLVFVTWRSRRVHLLLAADGIFYFILTLVDLLSHVVPAARKSEPISKAMELFLGSASFIPMLSYTAFLLWLSRREFITYLPRRHQPTVKYLLIVFCPVVVAINFVASLGVSIRNLSVTQAMPMIAFTDKSESAWLAISQLSMGLYTSYQCFIAFLAIYRLFTAFFNQQRIDTKQTDEHHFVNGTGWIAFGIKLGALESIIGFTSGGFVVPMSRRILRLASRACIIIGALKGMDENENFELLNNELVMWRRGKPLSAFRSLIANRRMSIRSSQFSDLSRDSSPNDKDMEGGKKDQHVTIHDECDQASFLHIRLSGLTAPGQAIHADGIGVRRQSARDTSTEVLASRNAARSSKSHTRHQSAQTIVDDMSVVYEITPDFPPGITGKDENELPVVDITRQQSMYHDTAQPSSEEGAAAESAGLYTSQFMERKPMPSPLSMPQPAHARMEGPVSPWKGIVSRHRGNYPVQFPVAPTRTGTTIYSPTAQKDEGFGPPQRRQRQLSSLYLFERASKARSDSTVHSSQWSTSPCSQLHTSPKMYGGEAAISPRRASADPGDVMSWSSQETLSDDRCGSAAPAGPRTNPQAAFNRERALRRLNGEISP